MNTEKWIPLHVFEEMTNNFSVDSIIGRGGYGVVYKGVNKGREFAVKLLNVENEQGLDDEQFKNEVGNLLRAKHPNIVHLVGYCYETKKIHVKHNGANDFSERIYRVLCFEYLQGGSLDKHLYGKSFIPNWSTCYNIIKGVCEGLNFLHTCDPQILHLDLKPGNILLDSSMEPKVADFGLSRLFTQSHTHVTMKIMGTRNYMPPECIGDHKISSKNDIFSLGVVMIDIMTGPASYSNSYEMGDMAKLIEQVLTKWGTYIDDTSDYRLEKIHQVKTCIEIAIRCVDSRRYNRPSIVDILDTLHMTETHMPKRVKSQVHTNWINRLKETSVHLYSIMIPDALRNGYESSNKILDATRNASGPSIDQVIKFSSKADKQQQGSSGMPGSVQLVAIKQMEKAPLFDHNTTMILELTGGDYTSARPGLDVVAVLDFSYGVTNHYRMMNEVKTALRFVLRKLGPMDRLSIVTFGKKLCPLRQINEASRQELQEMINRLESYGDSSPNLTHGLQTGLKILEDRKVKGGRVAAIMLVNCNVLGKLGGKVTSYSNVPVYTFGLGRYTDYAVLAEVAANSMGGTFSFLSTGGVTGGLTMALAQCLAGLLTVAVRDLQLTVATVRGQSMLLKVTARSYPQTHDGELVTVRFGDLYSGEVRKVIVDLGLPTVGSERSAEVLSVTYSYISSSIGSSSSSSAGRVQYVVPGETLTVWRTGVTPAEFQMEEKRNTWQGVDTIKKKKTLISRLWFSDKQEEENMLMDPGKNMKQASAYSLSSRSSHGLQRFTTRGKIESTRLFATPRMDMYLEQAKRFLQYPAIRLPSTEDDDVASTQHPMIYNVATREEELRLLRLTKEA